MRQFFKKMEDVEEGARRRPFSRSPRLGDVRFLPLLMKEVVDLAIQSEQKRGLLRGELF